jgi:hypothetical protein
MCRGVDRARAEGVHIDVTPPAVQQFLLRQAPGGSHPFGSLHTSAPETLMAWAFQVRKADAPLCQTEGVDRIMSLRGSWDNAWQEEVAGTLPPHRSMRSDSRVDGGSLLVSRTAPPPHACVCTPPRGIIPTRGATTNVVAFGRTEPSIDSAKARARGGYLK